MPDRPYTLSSCGLSIDHYLDSAAPRRLELSNYADFDRSGCHARLVRRDPDGRGERAQRQPAAAGALEDPARGADGSWAPAVADRGHRDRAVELDRRADCFSTSETETLVYCASPRVRDALSQLGTVATVVDRGQPVQMRRMSEDLAPPASLG